MYRSAVERNQNIAGFDPQRNIHTIVHSARSAPLLCIAVLFFAPASMFSQVPSSDFASDGASGLKTEFAATGGAGQAEPSAYRIERFTRVSLFLSVSSLGIGGQMSTNLSPLLDMRIFGNYASITTYHFSQQSFRIPVNVGFANVGAMADAYPFHKPFRLSGGYLFYNGDRVRLDFHADPNATLTIDDINWLSDNADPITGTGRLTLGGNGFIVTTGYGRMVSRSEKHFTFPFEAGVAFIDTPKVTANVGGEICSAQGVNCQPAATYPGFANALAAQLVKWNNSAAPFHIFPIVQGGVAYTFRVRR